MDPVLGVFVFYFIVYIVTAIIYGVVVIDPHKPNNIKLNAILKDNNLEGYDHSLDTTYVSMSFTASVFVLISFVFSALLAASAGVIYYTYLTDKANMLAYRNGPVFNVR